MSRTDAVSDRIRRMLAAELRLEGGALSGAFRWLDELGDEDVGYFLSKLNAEFTSISAGLSFGAGRRVFADNVSGEILERVATVAGLIEFVQSRIAATDR